MVTNNNNRKTCWTINIMYIYAVHTMKLPTRNIIDKELFNRSKFIDL